MNIRRYIPDEGTGEFLGMTEAVDSVPDEETFIHYPEYKRLKDALLSIATLWPVPPHCADITECNGINDGKQRTLVAVYALKISRYALGIPTDNLSFKD